MPMYFTCCCPEMVPGDQTEARSFSKERREPRNRVSFLHLTDKIVFCSYKVEHALKFNVIIL